MNWVQKVGVILLTICFFNTALAEGTDFRLIIHIDRSDSMSGTRDRISYLTDKITQTLEKNCKKFKVAVSEIDYRDTPLTSVYLLGSPKFISQETEAAAERIQTRIQDGSELGVCNENCEAARSVIGDKEMTYSSVANSIKTNAADLVGADFVASLIVTNAAPVIESLDVDQALDEIYKVIPRERYMAGAVAYTDIDHKYENCSMDFPDLDTKVGSPRYVVNSLNEFVMKSGGEGFNICQPTSFEREIEIFLNQAMAQAGCLMMM